MDPEDNRCPIQYYDIYVVETKHPITGEIQRSGRWSVTPPSDPNNNERN